MIKKQTLIDSVRSSEPTIIADDASVRGQFILEDDTSSFILASDESAVRLRFEYCAQFIVNKSNPIEYGKMLLAYRMHSDLYGSIQSQIVELRRMVAVGATHESIQFIDRILSGFE